MQDANSVLKDVKDSHSLVGVVTTDLVLNYGEYSGTPFALLFEGGRVRVKFPSDNYVDFHTESPEPEQAAQKAQEVFRGATKGTRCIEPHCEIHWLPKELQGDGLGLVTWLSGLGLAVTVREAAGK